MAKITYPYGAWTSPISPEALSGDYRIHDVTWDAETLIWLEGRGAESMLVALPEAEARCDLTRGMSIRGRVGYGGGEMTTTNGFIYFVGKGGRLYQLSVSGGFPKAITPEFGGAAAPAVSPDGGWIAYAHTYEGEDGIAMVDTVGSRFPHKLAYGTDFVMQPAWSPDGQYLAYVAWNHPNMPWDSSELRTLRLSYVGDGFPFVETQRTLAGGDDVAIFQPAFSPDGRCLAYVSDVDGWWHLHVFDMETEEHTQLTEGEAEYGVPAWGQGMRTYGWADEQTIFAIRSEKGFNTLERITVPDGTVTPVRALDGYTNLRQITISDRGQIALLASSATIPERLVTLRTMHDVSTLRARTSTESVPPSAMSEPQPVEWQGADGVTIYGLYYPPANDRYTGDGLPPLIVEAHGGPSGQRTARYDSKVQFFTTRGYAVLQVNYRGSAGYGRAYRQSLQGNWGVYDVRDCASGVTYLAGQGMIDPDKAVIFGSSAGGYTVLQSLVMHPGMYKAGISLYGVANQFALAMETHKFESHYNDGLLGTLPDAADVYRERSPIFHADNIEDPLLLFHGTNDKVVPINQSEEIVAVLRRRGVPHEYVVFEGEGHGFRKPENVKAMYERIEKFLLTHVIYS